MNKKKRRIQYGVSFLKPIILPGQSDLLNAPVINDITKNTRNM